MNRLLVALLSCAAACAQVRDEPRPPGPGDSAAPPSGKRLRAIWGVSGEIRQFLGFHDIERNEDCQVSTSPDGRKLYCLPALNINDPRFFADATCTQQVALGICGRVKIVTDTKYESFRPVVGTIARAYMRGADGSCQPAGPEFGSSFATLGEARPMSAFVSFTERDVDIGHRLRASVYEGADGSSMPLGGFYDTELDARCYFRRATDGVERCLPLAYADAVWDPTCTTPHLWPDDRSEFYQRRNEACGYEIYRAEGPAFEGACASLKDGVCKPSSSSCTMRALRLLRPDELATAKTETVTDGGRLEQTMLVVGSERFDAGVFDRERGERCFLTANGLCFPGGLGTSILSADASCKPTFATHNEWARCNKQNYRAFFEGCGKQHSLRKITDEVPTPTTLFTRDETGRCVERDAKSLTEGEPLFRLGDEVPHSSFASTQVVTEE